MRACVVTLVTIQVTEEERAIAKKVNYAMAFGVGKNLLMEQTGLPEKEVEAFMQVGESGHPKTMTHASCDTSCCWLGT